MPSIVLSLIVWFQFVYNLLGAIELGGKYMGWAHLLYSQGTLLPAILISLNTLHITFTSDQDKKQALLSKTKCHKIFACIYVGIVVLALIILPVSGYAASHFDQLAMQNITSTKKMLRFMDYYWVNL